MYQLTFFSSYCSSSLFTVNEQSLNANIPKSFHFCQSLVNYEPATFLRCTFLIWKSSALFSPRKVSSTPVDAFFWITLLTFSRCARPPPFLFSYSLYDVLGSYLFSCPLIYIIFCKVIHRIKLSISRWTTIILSIKKILFCAKNLYFRDQRLLRFVCVASWNALFMHRFYGNKKFPYYIIVNNTDKKIWRKFTSNVDLNLIQKLSRTNLQILKRHSCFSFCDFTAPIILQ